MADQHRTARSRTASPGEPDPVALGCEEVAALLGVSISLGTGLSFSVVRTLARIQNDLYDASAQLRAGAGEPPARLTEQYVERLGRAREHFAAELAPPAEEVLPGGTQAAAALHHCRAVVHRVQRAVREADADSGRLIGEYLAHLDQLLFILARAANAEHGDADWEPGLSARDDGAELWDPLQGRVSA